MQQVENGDSSVGQLIVPSSAKENVVSCRLEANRGAYFSLDPRLFYGRTRTSGHGCLLTSISLLLSSAPTEPTDPTHNSWKQHRSTVETPTDIIHSALATESAYTFLPRNKTTQRAFCVFIDTLTYPRQEHYISWLCWSTQPSWKTAPGLTGPDQHFRREPTAMANFNELAVELQEAIWELVLPHRGMHWL